MAIYWERAVPLAFHLCCFYFSAVLIVGIPFPFGVWGRMWSSIVSVPGRCLFIYFVFVCVEVLRPCQQLRSCRAGQLPINTVPRQA